MRDVVVNDRQVEIVADDLVHMFKTWKRQVIKLYDVGDAAMDALRKAAMLCITLNLDPRLFFDAQTDGCNPEKFHAPFLHSKYAVDKYKLYKLRHVTEVAVGSLYAHYNRFMLRLIELGNDLDRVLLSDHYDLPAWYRIIVTVESKPKVIDKYAVTGS